MHSMIADLNLDFLSSLNLDHMAAFSMVVLIVGIVSYFGTRKRQMWHETVRIALEKGQPLPPALANANWRASRYSGPWGLYRGLTWLAIGIGLSLVHEDGARRWAPLPICAGAAMILGALITSAFQKKPSDTQDPANRQ